MSRTRLAAVCAVLSTAVVAGMAALTVLAGDRSCDLDGCPAVASIAVSTAVHATTVQHTCTAPSTTPTTAPGTASTRAVIDRCARPARGDGGDAGAMATARVPAP